MKPTTRRAILVSVIGGKRLWLWRAVDSKILDMLVQR
jgi:transposase-like protein